MAEVQGYKFFGEEVHTLRVAIKLLQLRVKEFVELFLCVFSSARV